MDVTPAGTATERNGFAEYVGDGLGEGQAQEEKEDLLTYNL